MNRISAWGVVLALAAPVLAGCGAGGPSLYPVSGVVKYRGQPIGGALVGFFPTDGESEARPLSAVTDDQGRFQLTFARPGDGAPAGKYAVTVVWRELRQDGDEMLRNGRNLLPEHYSKAETSGLAATVSAGPTELPPFELTSR